MSLNTITTAKEPMFSHELVKPIFVGLTVAYLDNMINFGGRKDASSLAPSINFGLFSGAGVAMATYLGPTFLGSLDLKDGSFPIRYNGATMEKRLFEVACGAGLSATLSQGLNAGSKLPIMERLGIFIVADIVGEYISDYLTDQPMDFFS